MNRKIAFITEQDANYGFQLAGFDQFICAAGSLSGVLQNIAGNKEFGVVVIDERLVSEEDEEDIRERAHAGNLVLVILPVPSTIPAKKEDYAARLLRKAVGYHVRLSGGE
jgi:V/A-type H+-transporting ATPase subunit F